MVMLIMLSGLDLSVVLLVVIMLMSNNFVSFMSIELMFVVVLVSIWMSSSTYERGSAVSYLWFFSLVTGFALITIFELNIISFLLMLVILCNLPLVSLHIWLPNVHAEASMLSSVFLAGVILNAGSVMFYMLSVSMLFVLVPLVLVLIFVYRTIDGNVIVAMSSVLHMTFSVVIISMVWYVGWLHIVISPLIFIAVYVSYNSSSSRLSWSMASIVLLINLGFPIMGAFFSEIYFTSVMNIIPFLTVYLLSALFTLNLYIRGTECNNYYVLILVLFVMII